MSQQTDGISYMQNKLKNARQAKNSSLRARVAHETRRQIFCYLGVVGIALSVIISCGGSGNGSGGNKQLNLDIFKERFDEIKNDRTIRNWQDDGAIYAHYAASNVTLVRFKERFDEIKNDRTIRNWQDDGTIYANYAK